jgi:hypothetical protein
MSLNDVVASKLSKSGKPQKQVFEIAETLIEDAFIRMEKPQLTPLLTTDALCGSACSITESEVRVSIGNSDGFFNVTVKRAKEFVRKIVGASPGLLDDIVKGITKPIQDVFDGITGGIDGLIKEIQGFIEDGMSFMVNLVQRAFSTVGEFVGDSISFAIDKLGEGVNFITGTVNALLAGVAEAFNTFGLIIQSAFKGLGDLAENLFSFELEDILKHSDTLTQTFIDKQTAGLKKRAGVD